MLKQSLIAISCCMLALPNLAVAKTNTQKDSVVREFTAYGNISKHEGWRAVVKGNTVSLELTKNNEFHPKIKVSRSAYAKGVEFTGRASKKKFTLNINGKRCIDANGKANEFTATLYYKGKVMKGCAVRGAFGYAPT